MNDVAKARTEKALREALATIGVECRRALKETRDLERELSLCICIPRHLTEMLNRTGRVKGHLEEIEAKVKEALKNGP